MFILYVMSAHDKFPIPLHWLYIYESTNLTAKAILDLLGSLYDATMGRKGISTSAKLPPPTYLINYYAHS